MTLKSRLYATALTIGLSTPAAAATCASTSYADFVPCSVGNVQLYFRGIPLGPGSFVVFELAVDSITPYDDGTYSGLSVRYLDDFTLTGPPFFESAFAALPRAGYYLTGAMVASDARTEGTFSHDTSFAMDRGGGARTFPFDVYYPPDDRALVARGIGLHAYQYAPPTFTTVAFSVVPITQTPLPASWLLVASMLGLGGLFRWAKHRVAVL